MLNNLLTVIRMNLSNLTRDQRGVTVIEYAVIAALIIVVCIGIITLVGTGVLNTFTSVETALP